MLSMSGDAHASAGGSINQAIANAVVRQHRRYVGRGPSKAQAFYHHNVVVVVMADPFTAGERSLAADGRPEAVHRLRDDYRALMRDAIVDEVEELTGCVVDAYLGAVHLGPDLEAALFVLDRPLTTPDPAVETP
jgi:uncharacterized protein YbcI